MFLGMLNDQIIVLVYFSILQEIKWAFPFLFPLSQYTSCLHILLFCLNSCSLVFLEVYIHQYAFPKIDVVR